MGHIYVYCIPTNFYAYNIILCINKVYGYKLPDEKLSPIPEMSPM